MYDKDGKLIPEKGDLSKETLKYVWKNGIDNSFSQAERRILISQRLKQIRTNCNLTQKELCDKIDIVLTTYAGYEQGRHDIPTEIIARIAIVCGVSADYIIGLTDNPKGLYAGGNNNAKRKTGRADKTAIKVLVRKKNQ